MRSIIFGVAIIALKIEKSEILSDISCRWKGIPGRSGHSGQDIGCGSIERACTGRNLSAWSPADATHYLRLTHFPGHNTFDQSPAHSAKISSRGRRWGFRLLHYCSTRPIPGFHFRLAFNPSAQMFGWWEFRKTYREKFSQFVAIQAQHDTWHLGALFSFATPRQVRAPLLSQA